MKIISQFIRANQNGTFEKITWFKSKTGEKSCSKELVNPTGDQFKQILSSKYQEIFI